MLSYDDGDGLKSLMDLILPLNFKLIVIAYGTSSGNGYSFMDNLNDSRVIKVKEGERLGKTRAINQCLHYFTGELIYMMSSDITFDPEIIGDIESRFVDGVGAIVPSVEPVHRHGMVSATGVLLWNIRNVFLEWAQQNEEIPHGGELIAFRAGLIDEIPPVVNDEEYICMKISKMGHRVLYAPSLLVKNIAPDNVRDYLLQRSRVIYGHRQILSMGFDPKVMDFIFLTNPMNFLRNLARTFKKFPWSFVYLIPLLFMEIFSIAESRKYTNQDDVLKWNTVPSTKP